MDSPIRVLLVEDEPAVRRVTKRLLERLDTLVTDCPGPADAFQLFCQGPDEFDFVLSDQNMPGLSGHQLLEKIRKIRPNLAIALMSGRPLRECPKNCFLLKKPFGAKNLSPILQLVRSAKLRERPTLRLQESSSDEQPAL